MGIGMEKRKRLWLREGRLYIKILKYADPNLAKDGEDLLKDACNRKNLTKIEEISKKIRPSNPGLADAIDGWKKDGEQLMCDGG